MASKVKLSQTTHDQHYVQRKYLAHWENDEGNLFYKNFNYEKSKIQEKGASSVCFDLDYYKLYRLTEVEMLLVNSLSKNSPKKIRDHLLEFNSLPNAYFVIKGSEKVKQILEENKKEIENQVFTQFGESCISNLENVLDIRSWEAILNCDLTFLDDRKNVLNLITYIVLQRTRVEKIKEIIRDTIDIAKRELAVFPYKQVSEKRLFPYYVYNITVIQSFFMANSNHFRFHFLKPKIGSNESFLTSDNPVIDIDLISSGEAETKERDTKNQVSYFWPISPYVAIVVSNCLISNKIIEISDETIKKYNFLIKSGVRKYLIANSKTELIKYT